mgnify:CR=1 FL=1
MKDVREMWACGLCTHLNDICDIGNTQISPLLAAPVCGDPRTPPCSAGCCGSAGSPPAAPRRRSPCSAPTPHAAGRAAAPGAAGLCACGVACV